MCTNFQGPGRHRAWVEVNLDAIVRNVRTIRRLVGEKVRVLAVVKANAYGHGACAVVRSIHEAEPECWFGVATCEEAAEVRSAAPRACILLLSPTLPDAADAIVECGAIPVISDRAMVGALAAAARRHGRRLDVHVEIDTGMGRNGVCPEAAAGLLEAIQSSGMLRLSGIMTHFAEAEGNPEGSRAQLDTFRNALDTLTAYLGAPVVRHACNSAAMLRYPEAHMDMVRPGLAVYGLASRLTRGTRCPPLEPALALRARVLLIRTLKKGSRIGYSGTYTLGRDSRVAVIGLGYADGYPWHLSNRAEVLVRGRRFPIIGRICMDVCMADVTDAGDVQPGDVATVIGREEREVILAEDMAALLGTTEHEITTRLGPRLPRLYSSAVLESS